MTVFAKTALFATDCVLSIGAEPDNAWHLAISKLAPESFTTQIKECPRLAYLGLCEAGKVAGIRPGKYTPTKRSTRTVNMQSEHTIFSYLIPI
jgi:hypothetical protein